MRLRVLAVTDVLPKPDMQAGDRRFVALLEILARRNRVDLFVLSEAGDALEGVCRYRSLLEGLGVRLLPYSEANADVVFTSTYYNVGFFEFYTAAERFADEFRRCQPGSVVIVDSVDVHFAREAAGARLGVMDGERAEATRRRELAVYRGADAVIVASEPDGDILRAEGGMPPLFTVPIIMAARTRAGRPRGREVLFVGGFAHHPTLDGLVWFVKEMWPRVRDAVPEAVLIIIGSNPPSEVFELGRIRGIHVLGYVPDTNPFLDRAMVSVAPLRYGAGMKGKVIEAMASGVPVVTSSVGAQGIPAVGGEDLMLADEASEFAQALIALLEDPGRCERVGLAGQRLAVALCGPERVGRVLDEMLRAVVFPRRSLLRALKWWAESFAVRREAASHYYRAGRLEMWRGNMDRARRSFGISAAINGSCAASWVFLLLTLLPPGAISILRRARSAARY